MTSAALRGLVIATAVWVAAGCGGDGGDQASGPKPCTSDDQCSALEQCLDGACRTTCTTDDECPAGNFCDVVSGACMAGCRDDTECTGAQICQKGACMDPDADADGDGYPVINDCDDADPNVNPGAEETCNGVDDNCNGLTDEITTGAPLSDKQAGVCQGAHKSCAGKAGWVEPDYATVSASYEATEVSCDGVDNDCNGGVDDGLVPPVATLHDGVCAGAVQHCGGAGGWLDPDYSAIAGYEPYETGGCDGIDSNCDGVADEQWDADNDGYYSKNEPTCVAYYQSLGLVDCDDGDASFTGCVLYVDVAASGLDNGTTWANAFTSLHDALTAAKKTDRRSGSRKEPTARITAPGSSWAT